MFIKTGHVPYQKDKQMHYARLIIEGELLSLVVGASVNGNVRCYKIFEHKRQDRVFVSRCVAVRRWRRCFNNVRWL